MPVSIRTENEHGELGNKLTAMRGPLPVDIADPVERLRYVTEEMDELKASKQPLGAEAIWGLNDWFRDFAPPLLLDPTATINFSTRLFNLLVTNFPGPQIPFYVLGRELTAVYPIGFLARNHALAIAIFSYNGAHALRPARRPETVADLDSIGAYIDDSVQELLDIAGRRPPESQLVSRAAAGQVACRVDGDELAGDPRPRRAERRAPPPRGERRAASAAASSGACASVSPRAARR